MSNRSCSRKGLAASALTLFAILFLTPQAVLAVITTAPKISIPRSTAQLSQGRYDLSATSVGTKALFAGGGQQGPIYKTVDIYNAATDSWTVKQLSVARMSLAATTVGNIAIFAGGAPSYDLHNSLRTVDLYNDSTGIWTTAQLSQPRNRLAATSHGTKAYISGGVVTTSGGRPSTISNVIDVYDSVTQLWSTMTMPRSRYSHASVTVGDKIVFAGGRFDGIVDIYDAVAGTWSTGQLSSDRFDMAAAVVGNKAVFVGGSLSSQYRSEIDIYDASTNTWSSDKLPHNAGHMAGTAIGNLALFSGGVSTQEYDDVYVYNGKTNTWTTTVIGLSRPRFDLAATSLGNKAIFAGGYGSSVIDIFEVPEPATVAILIIALAIFGCVRVRN